MIRHLTATLILAAAAAMMIATPGASRQIILANATRPLPRAGYGVAPLAPSPPNPPGPKACAANFVQGVIGGQQKCLAAGQQCQKANANDYPKYGFTCANQGGAYRLSKNAARGPAPAKPAPAKPAPAKPVPSKNTH